MICMSYDSSNLLSFWKNSVKTIYLVKTYIQIQTNSKNSCFHGISYKHAQHNYFSLAYLHAFLICFKRFSSNVGFPVWVIFSTVFFNSLTSIFWQKIAYCCQVTTNKIQQNYAGYCNRLNILPRNKWDKITPQFLHRSFDKCSSYDLTVTFLMFLFWT